MDNTGKTTQQKPKYNQYEVPAIENREAGAGKVAMVQKKRKKNRKLYGLKSTCCLNIQGLELSTAILGKAFQIRITAIKRVHVRKCLNKWFVQDLRVRMMGGGARM